MGKEINPAFEALKQYLIQNYNAISASGGREVVKRCHICGDSRNSQSRHMYIGTKHGLIVYNCFKCNSHGIVDGKFMRDMELYDSDLISLINQNNQNSEEYHNILTKTRFLKTRTPILTYREAPETYKKLKYINSRLNSNYDFRDLANLKIVLNVYDFLNANGITSLSRSKDLVDLLDMFYLGFLSVDNSFITLRRLVDEGKMPKPIDSRYVNYNIYSLEGGYDRNYIVPANINPLKPIVINIAEGAFDIVQIRRMHLENGISIDNSIYAAICGKSYLGLIKNFIMNYGFINFIVHMYVDNDIEDWEINKVIEIMRLFKNPLYVHHNKYPGEKDYGVDINRIQDNVVRMI